MTLSEADYISPGNALTVLPLIYENVANTKKQTGAVQSTASCMMESAVIANVRCLEGAC